MNEFDLKKALSCIDVKADWIGIREVKETTTYRIVRDLRPESNNINIDHGIMIEVLVDGQFGYYGTHNLSYESVDGWDANLWVKNLTDEKYEMFYLDAQAYFGTDSILYGPPRTFGIDFRYSF